MTITNPLLSNFDVFFDEMIKSGLSLHFSKDGLKLIFDELNTQFHDDFLEPLSNEVLRFQEYKNMESLAESMKENILNHFGGNENFELTKDYSSQLEEIGILLKSENSPVVVFQVA